MVSEIFLNSSRTGYVMEFFVLLFLLFQARKVLTMFGILSFIIVLFGGAYLLSPIFQQRVDIAVTNVAHYTEGKSNTTSVGYRLYFYETSYDILKKNPVDLIFGHGSGSYKTVTQHYFNQLSDKNPNFAYSNFPNPHNQYILFLFENGIIGLLLFYFPIYTLALRNDTTNHLARCNYYKYNRYGCEYVVQLDLHGLPNLHYFCFYYSSLCFI